MEQRAREERGQSAVRQWLQSCARSMPATHHHPSPIPHKPLSGVFVATYCLAQMVKEGGVLDRNFYMLGPGDTRAGEVLLKESMHEFKLWASGRRYCQVGRRARWRACCCCCCAPSRWRWARRWRWRLLGCPHAERARAWARFGLPGPEVGGSSSLQAPAMSSFGQPPRPPISSPWPLAASPRTHFALPALSPPCTELAGHLHPQEAAGPAGPDPGHAGRLQRRAGHRGEQQPAAAS